MLTDPLRGSPVRRRRWEDRRQPTTTLEGWRRFVDADQATFDLLPTADRDALTDADRASYDEARVAYHAELIVVTTSTIRQILHQGRLLTLPNFTSARSAPAAA